MKKKFSLSLFLLTLILMFSSVSAFAEVPSTSRPSVIYASDSIFNVTTLTGPWLNDQWNNYSSGSHYSGWDKSTFHAINASANVSLAATSSSTYKLTGSTEFNILAVAKVSLGGEWGQSWGKTTTVTYDAQAGYTYELWSANVEKVRYWRYSYIFAGSTLTSNSTSYGNDGTTKWFFRY